MNENKNDRPVGSGPVAKADLTRVTNTPEERASAEARFAAEEAAREEQGWADLVEDVEIEDTLLEWGEDRG